MQVVLISQSNPTWLIEQDFVDLSLPAVFVKALRIPALTVVSQTSMFRFTWQCIH